MTIHLYTSAFLPISSYVGVVVLYSSSRDIMLAYQNGELVREEWLCFLSCFFSFGYIDRLAEIGIIHWLPEIAFTVRFVSDGQVRSMGLGCIIEATRSRLVLRICSTKNADYSDKTSAQSGKKWLIRIHPKIILNFSIMLDVANNIFDWWPIYHCKFTSAMNRYENNLIQIINQYQSFRLKACLLNDTKGLLTCINW